LIEYSKEVFGMSIAANEKRGRKGIGLTNEWAEDALGKGDLASALDMYVANEVLLRERAEQGPQDSDEAAEALKEAQFGKAKCLFLLNRLGDARLSAREALNSGFARAEGPPFDERRFTLRLLANAVDPEHFAKAWLRFATVPAPD
jgi:hypothetical protein